MIESLLRYVDGLVSSKEVIDWVNTTLLAAIKKGLVSSQTEAEHVIDYLNSDEAPKRLRRMSYEQALESTKKWDLANQKKGRDLVEDETDLEKIKTFGSGYYIAKLLTKRSFEREGFLMRHCLGGMTPGSEYDIFSLRDETNLPHATFEVRKNSKEINQVKGKGNGPIHPKYIDYVLWFLKHTGLDVRENEMRNLGYYFIHPDVLDYAKKVANDGDVIAQVGENWYAVER